MTLPTDNTPARKRHKVVSRAITKLPKGRGYQFDGKDSQGKRHRKVFATKEEAVAYREQVAPIQSAGEFIAAGANTTFSSLLDKLPERNRREGLKKGSQELVQSKVNAHLRPQFGAWKLTEFVDDRMQSFKRYLDELTEKGFARGTIQHLVSVANITFDLAVDSGLLAHNPVRTFKVKVPRNAKKNKRPPLPMEDISALMKGAMRRAAEDKHELTWCARGMMVLLGLLTGMRNEECSGLCWDCVDFVDREIHMRRVWDEEQNGLIESSKTGESGWRSIPMSPILFAALEAHRERLERAGFKVEGVAPVLVTSKASLVTSHAITAWHWAALAAKAGFTDSSGRHKHTFYALRTTFGTMLRTIGMEPDDLQMLMGHTDYKTTVENYVHRAKHLYADVRRDVWQVIQQLKLEHTPEGFIDALGFVLARRWKDEGMDIRCAPPRPKLPQLGADTDVLALPGMSPVLELAPNERVLEAPAVQFPKSVEEFRLTQIKRACELYDQGWTRTRIAAELGSDHGTVNGWLNGRGLPRGRLKEEVREALRKQVIRYGDAHPEATSFEIAQATGAHPNRVTKWLRDIGKPVGRACYPHKLAKYEAEIRRMLNAGKTYVEMSRALNDEISPSGIAYFVRKRIKAKTKRWGSGLRIDQFDSEIRQGLAEGKDSVQIAHELQAVHHSSISRYIRRLGLQTPEQRRGNAARARAKKAFERKQLSLDFGSDFGTAAKSPSSGSKKSA